jgi:hypothetical protein
VFVEIFDGSAVVFEDSFVGVAEKEFRFDQLYDLSLEAIDAVLDCDEIELEVPV